jgi:hypothetical protein
VALFSLFLFTRETGMVNNTQGRTGTEAEAATPHFMSIIRHWRSNYEFFVPATSSKQGCCFKLCGLRDGGYVSERERSTCAPGPHCVLRWHVHSCQERVTQKYPGYYNSTHAIPPSVGHQPDFTTHPLTPFKSPSLSPLTGRCIGGRCL